MKHTLNELVRVLATGLCVLVGMSVLLFWLRSFPWALVESEQYEPTTLIQKPSGLLPPAIESDPNFIQPSFLHCNWLFKRRAPLFGIAEVPVDWPEALFDDVFRDLGKNLDEYGIHTDWVEGWLGPVLTTGLENPAYPELMYGEFHPYILCWHPQHRLFVKSTIEKRKDSQGEVKLTATHVQYYGPNGTASEPESDLGRFTNPLFILGRPSERTVVYDRGYRRFFLLSEHDVTGGTPLVEAIHPVQLSYGNLSWQGDLIHGPQFVGPLRWETDAEFTERQEQEARKNTENITMFYDYGIEMVPIEAKPVKLERRKVRQQVPVFDNRHLMVLDNSGTVYRIDEETLSLSSPLGFLSGSRDKAQHPMDCLAYDARCTVYGDTVVTTVSKDGDNMTLDVFDPNGGRKHHATMHKDWASFPAGKVAAALSYGAEVLHPPILHGLSVVGLPQSTPLESHRSLLTMPLGVPARRARLAHVHPADGVFAMFSSLIPMVALSLFLAMRVDRDARRAGMAEARRGIWTSATVLLGLVAYITYRLTRPRTNLVTCTNCGKLRRTDQDSCQNCNAAWQMPELTAPSWRVLDLPD